MERNYGRWELGIWRGDGKICSKGIGSIAKNGCQIACDKADLFLVRTCIIDRKWAAKGGGYGRREYVEVRL